MTDGEKMVFAAVYADEFQRTMNEPKPREAAGISDEARSARANWEASNVDRAIEIAASAVFYLREAKKRSSKVHTKDTVVMLKDMLGTKR
jgi:hypothetical protein